MSIFQTIGKLLFSSSSEEAVYQSSFLLAEQKHWSGKCRSDVPLPALKVEIEVFFKNKLFVVRLFSTFERSMRLTRLISHVIEFEIEENADGSFDCVRLDEENSTGEVIRLVVKLAQSPKEDHFAITISWKNSHPESTKGTPLTCLFFLSFL